MTPTIQQKTASRRMRGPILQGDLVRIIAQTLPDVSPLRPQVPNALAQDAEYRLREVIRQAKSFMRHAKRSHLTVEDISNAYKKRDRQPVLGYAGLIGRTSVHYLPVEGTSGLYISKDNILKLTDVITAELPPRQQEEGIEPSWVAVAGKAQILRKDQEPLKRRRAAAKEELEKELSPLITVIKSVIENIEDEEQVDATLKAVATLKSIQPIVSDLVSFVRTKVHENARVTGKTEILFNATRFMCALFARSRFGVGMHYNHLIPALLTCLMGRRLGTGDHWSLRDLAASVLRNIFHFDGEPISRVRTVKTLVTVLMDPHAPLESMYGAIRGLIAMGGGLFESQVLPHVPALLRGLEKAANASTGLEPRAREVVEEKIARVCQVLDDASNEPLSEDGDLKPLMEVYL